MNNRSGSSLTGTVITLTTPFARVFGFVFKAIHVVLFRWWLDKRIVKKSNERFAKEILGSLPFLCSDYGAKFIPNDREPGASFDFAYVTVSVAGLILRFCRGLGTISIDVSSVHNPRVMHDLSSVLNAIDATVKRQSYSDLSEVEPTLRSHMTELIDGFFEQKYAGLAKQLSEVYAHDRAMIHQWETETDRRLYEK